MGVGLLEAVGEVAVAGSRVGEALVAGGDGVVHATESAPTSKHVAAMLRSCDMPEKYPLAAM